MGNKARDPGGYGPEEEEIYLRVDDRGRVTLPKNVREQLGIESHDEIPATVKGSVLTLDPKPSEQLYIASSERTEWEGTTPTDAGKTLFGTFDEADDDI